jgi:uncharacterized protein involved in copper resistance
MLGMETEMAYMVMDQMAMARMDMARMDMVQMELSQMDMVNHNLATIPQLLALPSKTGP